MFISSFKKNRVYLPVVMVFVTFVLWLDGFLYHSEISVSENNATLYEFFVRFLETNKLLNVIIAFVFLIVQSFLINNVVTSKNLVERYSYMPGFIYAVLMSSSFDMLSLHPVLIANFFLILSLNKILDVFTEDRIYLEVFNAGFLISLATLFYFPAIYLIILAVISLFIYFITNLRRIIAIMLGFFTPFFFIGLYFFMTDQLQEKVYEFIALYSPFLIFNVDLETYFQLYLIVFAFIAVIALFKVFFIIMTENPFRIRRRYNIIFMYLLIALFSLLFIPNLDFIHHALINIPMAVILSAFFHSNKKKLWNELLFSLLIIFILATKLDRFE